jgi:hypothetical protein
MEPTEARANGHAATVQADGGEGPQAIFRRLT